MNTMLSRNNPKKEKNQNCLFLSCVIIALKFHTIWSENCYSIFVKTKILFFFEETWYRANGVFPREGIDNGLQ